MTDEENTWKSGQTFVWSNAENIKLGPLEPNCVTFYGIVKIYTDCRVEIAEGATLDDAARAFWDGVKTVAPFILKNAVEEEREACAKVAEAHRGDSQQIRDISGNLVGTIAGNHIATAIRARGKT